MCLAQSGLAGRNGLASNKQTTLPGSYLHRPSAKRNGPSFDHLVGECEQPIRHRQAERFGGLEVDNQHVSGGELDREVGRLLALKNAVDVTRREPILIDQVRSVDRLQAQLLSSGPRTLPP